MYLTYCWEGEGILRKYFYGTLAIIGLTVLLLVDLMMVVPLASNQTIVLVISLLFYIYLLYLIVFRKIV